MFGVCVSLFFYSFAFIHSFRSIFNIKRYIKQDCFIVCRAAHPLAIRRVYVCVCTENNYYIEIAQYKLYGKVALFIIVHINFSLLQKVFRL